VAKKLLDLTPTHFLCPYCGNWHKWNIAELGYYDSEKHRTRLKCSNAFYYKGDYGIYFYEDYCYYFIEPLCRMSQSIRGKVPISSIIERVCKPFGMFKVSFVPKSKPGSPKCSTCRAKNRCLFADLGNDEGNIFSRVTITLGFKFKQSDYEQFTNATLFAHMMKEL